MLVVTPAPYPTESLVGYTIRLTEVNGYDSPGVIMSYAGYGKPQALGINCDLRPLEKVIGRSAESLSSIAYGDMEGNRFETVRFRGHETTFWRISRILSPKQSSVCPHCIVEQGFLDSFWDLTLATVCPKHGCKALRTCPSCSKKISWMRPGLLECRCGTSFDDSSLEPAPNCEVELLALVQATLENKRIRKLRNASRFPLDQLRQMTLVQLVSTIFILGQNLRSLSPKEATEQPELVVQAAAQALGDWPRGYRRSLRSLGNLTGDPEECFDRLRDLYGALYRALVGGKVIAPVATFLRDELLKFLKDEFAAAALDSRRLGSKSRHPLRKPMSASWVCARYDFSQKRLEGWCRYRGADKKSLSKSDLETYVIETEVANYLRVAQLNQIVARQAAAMVKLPQSVLKGLCHLGYVRYRAYQDRQRGFHVSDIRNLIDKMKRVGERVSASSIRDGKHVSLTRVLDTATFWSRLGKSEFLVDVLEEKVETFGRTGDSPQQLFFDRKIVNRYIDMKKSEVSKHGLTMTEAGRVLNCSSNCIPELVRLGQLEMITGPCHRNVCRESVRAFGDRYVALNYLANHLETSVQALRREADKQGFGLLLILSKRRVTTPFSRRSHAVKLHRIVGEQQSEAARQSAIRRNRPSSIDKISRYLNSLRNSGQPLPRIASRPNIKRIAECSGVYRNNFYNCKAVADLLAEFDREDISEHRVDTRTDIEVLEDYLRELSTRGVRIPVRRCGRLNKLAIARAAGVNRNVFYESPDAENLVAQYQENIGGNGAFTGRNRSTLQVGSGSVTGGVQS